MAKWRNINIDKKERRRVYDYSRIKTFKILKNIFKKEHKQISRRIKKIEFEKRRIEFLKGILEKWKEEIKKNESRRNKKTYRMG